MFLALVDSDQPVLVRAACVTVGTVSANCLSRTRTATDYPDAQARETRDRALIFLNALKRQ
jgi:hypothetical protein